MTIRHTVHRRTFGATHFPIGSPERSKLNERAFTSEYLPSYRYIVVDRDNPRSTRTFKRKSDAVEYAERLDAEVAS